MMDPLLIKFYNNYAIIHIQHSPKPSYIKHYHIIHASHKQLTSWLQTKTRFDQGTPKFGRNKLWKSELHDKRDLK